jgi:hypothetical protein
MGSLRYIEARVGTVLQIWWHNHNFPNPYKLTIHDHHLGCEITFRVETVPLIPNFYTKTTRSATTNDHIHTSLQLLIFSPVQRTFLSPLQSSRYSALITIIIDKRFGLIPASYSSRLGRNILVDSLITRAPTEQETIQSSATYIIILYRVGYKSLTTLCGWGISPLPPYVGGA